MVEYSHMTEGEEERIYDLIARAFNEYVAPIYSNEGVEYFLGMISPKGLRELNEGKSSFVIVARQVNELIGMIAVREESHIALIFIDSEYQRRGIGKNLINKALTICLNRDPKMRAITVSSSPNLKSFYEEIGFKAKGEEVDECGMRFAPMQKTID
jgi:ribosomal protein S18 acetylase RimI-like enzyme